MADNKTKRPGREGVPSATISEIKKFVSENHPPSPEEEAALEEVMVSGMINLIRKRRAKKLEEITKKAEEVVDKARRLLRERYDQPGPGAGDR
mgnify:CR=1 FL=1